MATFYDAVTTALAELPPTGGVVDATAFEGLQTIDSSIVIDKPCKLLLGGATITATSGPLFEVSSSCDLVGVGDAATTLKSAPSSPIFAFAGKAVRRFKLSALALLGGGGTSCAFAAADYSATFDMAAGLYVFEDLYVGGFGAPAMTFGVSCYYVRILGCIFSDNRTSLKFSHYSEAEILDNHFSNQGSTVCDRHVWLVGGSSMFRIVGNNFENGGGVGTTEDIFIAAARDGHYVIENNKFGGESDIAGRAKITLTASGAAIEVNINRNRLLSQASLANTAIQIQGAIESCSINDNWFSGFARIVDDSFELVANTGAQGHSSFTGNKIYQLGQGDLEVFTHGGRGFSALENPLGATEENAAYLQTMSETPGLSNRLSVSEAFDRWTLNGVSAEPQQIDPMGTRRAFVVTKAGAPSGYLALGFESPEKRMTFSLWAKAGTARKMQVSVYAAAPKAAVEVRTFVLTEQWQRFKWTVGGLEPSGSYQVIIYPDGQDASTRSIFLFGAQAADHDSAYLPTQGTTAFCPRIGSRWERAVWAAGGITVGHPSGVNPSPSQTLDVRGSAAIAGAISTSIRSVSATTTLLPSDSVVIVKGTTGPITVTLPQAAAAHGQRLICKNVGAHAATVKAIGSIDDGALSSITLDAQGMFVELVSDGSTWYVIGKSSP
jgi:hypothetical protein